MGWKGLMLVFVNESVQALFHGCHGDSCLDHSGEGCVRCVVWCVWGLNWWDEGS